MKVGISAFCLSIGIVALAAAIIANYLPFYIIAGFFLLVWFLFQIDPTKKRKFRISHTKIYPGGRQENEIMEVYTTKKDLVKTLKDLTKIREHIDEIDEKGKLTIIYRTVTGTVAFTAIYQIL